MSTYKYAILDNNNFVCDVVISDNPDAEAPLKLLIPTADKIILVTDETKEAYVGGQLVDGKFKPMKPCNSWIWNEEIYYWQPPFAPPLDGKTYTWDEDSISWKESIVSSNGPAE